MKYIKTYKVFESEHQDPQLDVLIHYQKKAEDIRNNIVDIFYDLEDLDFDIHVQLLSGFLYDWVYQVRMYKKDNSSFSFDEVRGTIERFISYINPYASVISSFPGRNPIDFQIEHHRWSLHDRLKYNLSYDDMKSVMDKDDTASAGWVDGRHVTPKLGDNLRTIYIQATTKIH